MIVKAEIAHDFCPPTVPEFYEAPGILKAIFASGDKMLKVCPRFERVHSCSVLEKWKKTS